MAAAVKMIDPDGNEHEIVAAGAAALEALGWKRAEKPAPAARRAASTDKK